MKTHLCIIDVGSGVPDRQDAVLFRGVAAGVEPDVEVAVHARALLDPVADVRLLALWGVEGDPVGEHHLLVRLRQPGDDQSHLHIIT